MWKTCGFPYTHQHRYHRRRLRHKSTVLDVMHDRNVINLIVFGVGISLFFLIVLVRNSDAFSSYNFSFYSVVMMGFSGFGRNCNSCQVWQHYTWREFALRIIFFKYLFLSPIFILNCIEGSLTMWNQALRLAEAPEFCWSLLTWVSVWISWTGLNLTCQYRS